jgi:hypothetical protein
MSSNAPSAPANSRDSSERLVVLPKNVSVHTARAQRRVVSHAKHTPVPGVGHSLEVVHAAQAQQVGGAAGISCVLPGASSRESLASLLVAVELLGYAHFRGSLGLLGRVRRVRGAAEEESGRKLPAAVVDDAPATLPPPVGLVAAPRLAPSAATARHEDSAPPFFSRRFCHTNAHGQGHTRAWNLP